MSQLDYALSQVGVDLSGAGSFSSAVDAFTAQNMTPRALSAAAQMAQNSLMMGMPPINTAGSPGLNFGGAGGEWTAIHYADDLIPHQPKFKFLFKVSFEGFGARDFYYYVLRCDKPRIQLNHTDVNYYNFRTRVLTSATFQPLTCTFYDEIGNTTNDFFASYLNKVSGTASGNWGIDRGFGPASSTKPYQRGGYSTAQKIVVEQIFANGVMSNRFNFINPRIESFDFDELNMEETAGSLLTVTFSYDALESQTVKQSTIHTWGATDLLRGGGTSGPSAAGVSSVYEDGYMAPTSASGNGIDGGGNPRTPQGGLYYDALNNGIAAMNDLPPSLADLVAGGVNAALTTTGNVISSVFDTVSTGISETLASIQSGSNLQSGNLYNSSFDAQTAALFSASNPAFGSSSFDIASSIFP